MTGAKTASLVIEDAGDHVPRARKHLAKATGTAQQEGLRLEDLFPAPDWKAMIASGRPAPVVARLAMVYDSIALAPKADGLFGLSEREWEDAYRVAIPYVRAFIQQADSIEKASNAANWMAAYFGEDKHSIVKRQIREVAPYWAAGPGGQRTMRPIGSFTLRQRELANWMHMLGWPDSDDVLLATIVPCLQEDGSYALISVRAEECRYITKHLPDLETALFIASDEITRLVANSAKAGRKSRKGRIERVGPPVDLPRDLTPEFVMHAHNLRAIQFGEWFTQAERRRWLRHLSEGLADLQRVTGFRPRWLGLGGIAIAAGARGVGGAAAHYESDLRVANLTRVNGAGSLAHEWWHAFDHRLGMKNGQDLATRDFDAYGGIAVDGPLGSKLTRLCLAISRSKLKQQARRIEELPRARKGYWGTMVEMTARVFESWVEDELKALGQCSPYLVHGTLEEDWTVEASLSMYPVGEERQQLGALVRDVVRTASEMSTAANPATQDHHEE